jgi:hypothetical protein
MDHDRVQWRSLVNMIMNLYGSINGGQCRDQLNDY